MSKFLMIFAAFAAGLALTVAPATAMVSAVSPNIRLNQVGFHPQGSKKGVVVNTTASTFFIATPDLADTVFTGDLGEAKLWVSSGEQTRLADFSACVASGRYVLGVPGLGVSHPFRIDPHVALELTRGSIRAFYYQRASAVLSAAHAGKWARNAGHPDNRAYVHSSAASASRPAESVVSAGKGWYDAGDYNKYVVNSGISTYTLLALYRHYPSFFDTLKLNIPESGNALPDLLDEILWNLRWMMAMQDPNDGGAYHKLTSPDFSGMVMPEADVSKRYVVQKSVTATLDLCATAAYASRLFRRFNGPLPGFADSALNVARKAWKWSRENPSAFYKQVDLNKAYAPAINTGEYGDGNASDELFWAGMEMYLATREDSFFVAAAPTGNLPASFGVPGWPSVSTLGLFSLIDEVNGGFEKIDSAMAIQRLVTVAKGIRDRSLASPYNIPLGTNDFFWGSNSNNANQGMFLIQAFRATGDTTFLKAAGDALDYLLGRNATGYSFVTGFGAKPPLFPHHRPSTADGVREPVPGMLVGGPNSGQQDKCVYPSTLPALSYSDTECSYASNEIAINWNAPLAYLAGALEAMLGTGAPALSTIPRVATGKAEAWIGWEGRTLRVILPHGWKGKLEVFDMRGGRINQAAMDTAGGLWVYRLQARSIEGMTLSRTGTLSPYSALRISLRR
ncbi:MAG: glycoside hydrolase family 9 protein [Fibrobacterota bacterium]|nr:glycoside hydrolase family 9 protein [Fibrobacterota bacterium]